MDYLPEVVQAGNVNGFQKGLDRRVNGRTIKESFRKLRSTPCGGEFWVAQQALSLYVYGLFVDNSLGLARTGL